MAHCSVHTYNHSTYLFPRPPTSSKREIPMEHLGAFKMGVQKFNQLPPRPKWESDSSMPSSWFMIHHLFAWYLYSCMYTHGDMGPPPPTIQTTYHKKSWHVMITVNFLSLSIARRACRRRMSDRRYVFIWMIELFLSYHIISYHNHSACNEEGDWEAAKFNCVTLINT